MNVPTMQPPQTTTAPPEPYAIVLQKGMKKFNGHIFIGDSALYFVCSKSGTALWDAVGAGVGGLVGGAISVIGDASGKKIGDAPDGPVTEEALRAAVEANPGSMVFEPSRINVIKQTLWTRLIRYDGQTYGARSGFPKPLRKELGPWTERHGVKQKGMG